MGLFLKKIRFVKMDFFLGKCNNPLCGRSMEEWDKNGQESSMKFSCKLSMCCIDSGFTNFIGRYENSI
jgi:hypothetical protein